MFLLRHSNINPEDVYATLSGTPFIQSSKSRTLGLPNSLAEYTSF